VSHLVAYFGNEPENLACALSSARGALYSKSPAGGARVQRTNDGFGLGFVQSFGTQSGIVATVTGNGTVVPTIGNQSWFEYGGRLGYRISKGWVADVFVNGTAGPQPVGNTIHGGIGLRVSY